MKPAPEQTDIQVVIAQQNFLVGDIAGNCERILATIKKTQADLLIFPELALSGYPPEDLLLRRDLHAQIDVALAKIIAASRGRTLVLGYPELRLDKQYNAAAIIQDGKHLETYRKQKLPNYGVFDEHRYFHVGSEICVFDCHGRRFGIIICEDLWWSDPIERSVAAGAEAIICINASPFDHAKAAKRDHVIRKRIEEAGVPILYAHLVGGQDELIFDGGSVVYDAQGTLCQHGGFFQENNLSFSLRTSPRLIIEKGNLPALPTHEAMLYQALVFSVRDYAGKNGFKTALLGLSGGIDSALSLCIACDALGAANVTAVMMATQYTSDMSLEDAKALAQTLQAEYIELPIQDCVDTLETTLGPHFADMPKDITEENLQARVRGVLLMALSNKHGSLVLTTGNKSEMAVGYATLYGDMAGGFCVLKDVPKTLVYQLSEYRNRHEIVIPKRIISRAPTAELRHEQKDEDTLPPYNQLDDLLHRFIEEDASLQDLQHAGFDEATIVNIAKMVKHNEYKRRQAPIGAKISGRAFGRDRRYPVTSGFDITAFKDEV